MKKIKIMRMGFLTVLIIMLAVPVIEFNFKENCASPIDNRMLTEWDLHTENTTAMIDDYVNDRIGMRTEAIDEYTLLNDKVFGMMIHPTYTYGKNDYVFFQMSIEEPEETFFDLFCAYLRRVQDYCEERNVPFIYCLNPSKITVYEQYLPKGYHYKDKVNQIMRIKLEEYGVNYISNEELLKEKSKSEQVYNVKFDAGHWNDWGAFYGTNHLLEKVAEYFPEVKPHEISDFDIEYVNQDSLLVSHFPINEDVPYFSDKDEQYIEDITSQYESLKLDENYHDMACLVNRKEGAEALPKVLMFQGSYYNERYRFLESSFKEYDAIHNYENFIDFEYYFNIFQPDCVILETAEYATNGDYFSYEGLEHKQLNHWLDVEQHEDELEALEQYPYDIEEADRLVKIDVNLDEGVSAGYLIMKGRQFDFAISEDGTVAECTLDRENYEPDGAKVFWIR